ncbi:MAG TPA: hypothetical protein DCP92_17185, partial [Nitrospiraceae bacterium]|nr:hypothetical protein [Nitrospiraceae bacterium]
MLRKCMELLFDKPFFTDLIYPQAFQGGAYLLYDGSVGMMWEIDGINIDGRSPEEIQKASTTFSNFLKSLPQDVPIQIIAATWRGIEQSSLDVYLEGDLSNPYTDEYMRRMQKWHEHGKLHGFAHEGTNHFYPRTIKVFFTVKQKPLYVRGTLHDKESIKEA